MIDIERQRITASQKSTASMVKKLEAGDLTEDEKLFLIGYLHDSAYRIDELDQQLSNACGEIACSRTRIAELEKSLRFYADMFDPAVRDVVAERRRQIEVAAEHEAALARAAVAYSMSSRADLVRTAALTLAEIERRDRARRAQTKAKARAQKPPKNRPKTARKRRPKPKGVA